MAFGSGDEDQAQERINKLARILRDKEVGANLHTGGVGVVSCIIQRDEGRAPMRHSFHWSAEKLYYEEEPLLRHLEPPLSIFLELVRHFSLSQLGLPFFVHSLLSLSLSLSQLGSPLFVQDKLKGYENIKYMQSRDRQWHLYTVVDKPVPIQRMFLRTLVRQPTTSEGFEVYQGMDAGPNGVQWALCFTSKSILRSLMAAMEELELHVHNETLKTDHAHMYLCILREQQIEDLVPYPR